MKKIILSIYFQIGVNIIGIPEFIKHDFAKSLVLKSTFHK